MVKKKPDLAETPKIQGGGGGDWKTSCLKSLLAGYSHIAMLAHAIPNDNPSIKWLTIVACIALILTPKQRVPITSHMPPREGQ